MVLSGSETTTTTSSPPFSPLSIAPSAGSETSEDPGDLGAFHSVFRALTLLNSAHAPPTNFLRHYPGQATSSSLQTTASASSSFTESSEHEDDSDFGGVRYPNSFPSSVWDQRRFPVNTVDLTPDEERDQPSPAPPATPPEYPVSRSEDDEDTEGLPEDDDDELMPALTLDEALGFLAAERAKFTASLQVPANGDASSRKKRRRRRRVGSNKNTNDEAESPEVGGDTTTSTGEPLSPIVPTSSRKASKRDRLSRKSSQALLAAPPAETAVIAVAQPSLPSPQVQRLRSLAHKLKSLYPSHSDNIKAVLNAMNEPEPGGFIEIRGPEATPDDPPVHVFIDYSNILIGFLSYIRRHPELFQRKSREDKLRMSHEALSLILERGRPTARRELAASKPLYQPMTSAYALGFDVHLFQRVPHGDPDSTDTPPISPVAPPRPRGHQSSLSDPAIKVPSLQLPPPNPSMTTRPKWREQGVDECLQLKMYQSVVGDGPPGTIVLATGDGAASQFNSAGFPGNVKVALDRGWNVELYAWESGLSAGWRRTFGTHERFSVRGLEMFAEDLVAIDPPA